MKKKKHRRFWPTLIIAVTLYLFDPVPATAAGTPAAVSDNTLPAAQTAVSENALPAAQAAVSENALPAAQAVVSENALPAAPAAEADCISSAAELCAWLNAHMGSGGRAKLTENITMDSSFIFVPHPNLPPLFVEIGGYTIFVRADVELWSDGHLTFSGEGSAQGMFHVEKGGSLLLDGVTVKTPAKSGDSLYALWQEEGASLTVGNTFAPGPVTGKIHYADTPFVADTDPVCVVVEQGQRLDGQLPAKVTCRVNYQGSYLEQEPIAVSWDLTDTQKQQEERQRFQAQGVFSQAQSQENPVCTVVYHDYPLTFTCAEAFIRRSAYTFRGGFIKQEEAFTAVTSPEYSFDGENWIREGENNTLSADDGFYISFPCDQWDTEAHPYIHIRLRAETEDTVYYSNVIRYTANNLDVGEDLGGSRGGGTAVVDPPTDPEEQKKPGEADQPAEPNNPTEPDQPAGPNKPAKPGHSAASNTPVKSDKPTEAEKPSQPKSQEDSENPQNQSGSTQNRTDTPAAAAAKIPKQSAEAPAQTDTGSGRTRGKRSEDTVIPAQSPAVTSAQDPSAAAAATDEAAGRREDDRQLAKSTLSSAEMHQDPTDDNASSIKKTAPAPTTSAAPAGQTGTLLLAAGFVLLSAAAGVICFLIHIHGGTDSFHRRKSASSGGTKR